MDTENKIPYTRNGEYKMKTLIINRSPKLNGDTDVLVCIDDKSNIIGAIVGSSETYYNCKQFFVKDFFILPEYQGKGIGTAMITELETQLKNKT